MSLTFHLIHYVLAHYHVPSILKLTLRYLHFKEDDYYTHSVRVGTTTTAANPS